MIWIRIVHLEEQKKLLKKSLTKILKSLLSSFTAMCIRGRTDPWQLSNLFKEDVPFIDEFLLTAVNETERNDLLELIEKRTNKKSTIFCSQWSPEG